MRRAGTRPPRRRPAPTDGSQEPAHFSGDAVPRCRCDSTSCRTSGAAFCAAGLLTWSATRWQQQGGSVRPGAVARAQRHDGSTRRPNGRPRSLDDGSPRPARGGTERESRRSTAPFVAGEGPGAPDSRAWRRNRIPRLGSSVASSAVSPVLGCQFGARLIAANGSAPAGIAISGRCQWNHQDPTGHLGAHEPVRWRNRRVEQRIAGPHVIDVVHAKVGMLEQVRSLRVDLEDVSTVEKVQVESLSHTSYCIPNNYSWGYQGRRRGAGTRWGADPNLSAPPDGIESP